MSQHLKFWRDFAFLLGYVFAINNLLDSRMRTLLCCVIFRHYLCHIVFLCPSIPSAPVLDAVVMTVVRGLSVLSITECKMLTILEWHQSEELQPPISFQTNPFSSLVYVNVCVQNMYTCLSVSVHLSLSELNGEKQVEWQPTLLILCLTCEIQHPLKWWDTSLPMGACVSVIKLW